MERQRWRLNNLAKMCVLQTLKLLSESNIVGTLMKLLNKERTAREKN